MNKFPASEKVLKVLNKISKNSDLIQFEVKNDQYHFSFKGKDLFLNQDNNSNMFFGISGIPILYSIPETYRETFYKIVWPEKVIDEILNHKCSKKSFWNFLKLRFLI